MTDAITATTFVLTAKLPWLDASAAPETDDRFEQTVLLSACGRTPCAIRDISPLGATLEGRGASVLGDEVELELASGQRAAATVIWSRGNSLGVRFKRPIDVVALITRQLVAQPVERRTMPRVEVRASAWIRKSGDFVPTVIRNISAGGVQLEGEGHPSMGEPVQIMVEGLGIPPGEVLWKQSRLAGVRFTHELNWQALLPWIREHYRGPKL